MNCGKENDSFPGIEKYEFDVGAPETGPGEL